MFDYSRYNKVKPKVAKPVRPKIAAAPVVKQAQNFMSQEIVEIPKNQFTPSKTEKIVSNRKIATISRPE